MKKQLLFVGLVASFMLTACGGGSKTTTGPVSVDELPNGDGVTLKISAVHDANYGMSFNSKINAQLPFTGPDGVQYTDGMLKPVWTQLEKDLSFKITDVGTAIGKTAEKNFKEYWLLKGFEGVDILNGNAVDFTTYGTIDKSFVDLTQYWDYLPNFKKLVDENEVIRKSISTASGSIYFTPYFDGYNSIERMPLMRYDWVKTLLDGSTTFAGSAEDTINLDQTFYTPTMPATLDTVMKVVKKDNSGVENVNKKYTTNFITTMNNATDKTPAGLVNAFRTYIDNTYKVGNNSYYGETRSDLFIGQNAAYDADELVALLRLVKLNSAKLCGSAFGTELGVVPFYPRGATPQRTVDIFRWAGTTWGVRGLESRKDFLFVDDNGELQDSRLQDKTYDVVASLNQLYKEGIFHQGYNVGTKAWNNEFTRDRNRGFMTYDYNQTQTIFNDKNISSNKTAIAVEDFHLAPVLPAAFNWEGGNNYYQFSESIRSVKTNAWGINASLEVDTGDNHKKLRKSLEILDYMYSDKGHKLMSFGPDSWIDGTIEYNGEQIPKLNTMGKKANGVTPIDLFYAPTLSGTTTDTAGAAGNFTNFLRGWLGSTFPIGYIKNQGVEFQLTHEFGREGEAKINNAIIHGTMKVIKPQLADGDRLSLTTVPTILPFKAAEESLLATFSDLSANFITSNTEGAKFLFNDIVINGFGATGDITTPADKAALATLLRETYKGNDYLAVQRLAYARLVD